LNKKQTDEDKKDKKDKTRSTRVGMSSVPSLADRRRAEIEAKRSKLAALKKQREERTRNAGRTDRLSSVFPSKTLI
jgi:hypothetical protein